MSKNRRIAWLDATKGIAIILVVASHSIGGTWFYAVAPFMMPLFFVAAGFSLNLRKWKGRHAEFFWNRARRILLPFFLLEFAFWPIWAVRGLFMPPVGTKLPPFEALGGILEGNIAGLPLIALWFLPCFFLAEIIFLLIFPADHDKPTSCDVFLALFLSVLGCTIGRFANIPWGLDIALFVQGYMLLGRQLRAIGVQKLPVLWCVVLPVILIAVQIYVNVTFDMASREYGANPVLAYISGMGGCIMIMRLMHRLIDDNDSFLAETGRRSMAVYLLHPFVQIVITDILLATIIDGDYAVVFYIWQAGIVIAILGILLPIYISRHWAQKPFLRYLGL